MAGIFDDQTYGDCLEDLYAFPEPDCYAREADGVAFWPPSDLYRRRCLYDLHMALYRGEHTRLFRGVSRGLPTGGSSDIEERYITALYLSVNLLRKWCAQQGDLAFRQAPTIDVRKRGSSRAASNEEQQAQAAVDRIAQKSHFQELLYSIARCSLPAKGDAAFKLHVASDDSEVRITAPSMNDIVWTLDPLDYHNFTEATIGLVRKDMRKGAKANARVLWREVHTAGLVENFVHELLANDRSDGVFKIGQQLKLDAAFDGPPPDERYETGLPNPTIYKLPNMREDGQFFGVSDFSVTTVQLQRAVTTMLSDWLKARRAKIYGGHLVLGASQQGATRSGLVAVGAGVSSVRAFAGRSDLQYHRVADRNRMGILYEDEREKGAARYISTEETGSATDTLWMHLVRALAFELGMDVRGLFEDSSGGAQSGVAMRLQAASAISVVAAKAVFIVPVLEQVFFDAQVFEMVHRKANGVPAGAIVGWPDAYLPMVPTVTLNYGITEDPADKVDAIKKRTEGDVPTLSQQTAIERLENTDADGALAEMKRIADERYQAGLMRAQVYDRGSGALKPVAVNADTETESESASKFDDESEAGRPLIA